MDGGGLSATQTQPTLLKGEMRPGEGSNETVYPPRDGKPRDLTHDEVVRVDAFSMGPADFHEQRHARYDRAYAKTLGRSCPKRNCTR